MAEIIELCPARPTPTPAPLSFGGWVRQRLIRLHQRRGRIGNADDLPDRMRRDMGLAPAVQEPGRHYTDYLISRGW